MAQRINVVIDSKNYPCQKSAPYCASNTNGVIAITTDLNLNPEIREMVHELQNPCWKGKSKNSICAKTSHGAVNSDLKEK